MLPAQRPASPEIAESPRVTTVGRADPGAVGQRRRRQSEHDTADDQDRAHRPHDLPLLRLVARDPASRCWRCQPAGTSTWLIENVTPAGSASTAERPGRRLERRRRPSCRRPARSARRRPRGRRPRSRRASARPARPAPSRRRPRARRAAGLAADVAGQAEQRERAEGLGRPAEHLAVERGGGVGVGGLELAHRPRARLVDELRAVAGARLPRVEAPRRPGRRRRRGGRCRTRAGRRSRVPPARSTRRGRRLGGLDADLGQPGRAAAAGRSPAPAARSPPRRGRAASR